MPDHVLSVGTQQRSRQKIKSFLNSVILGIDMSYEESTAEEEIAGAIFSRLITEAMFEQGPPWLKQWINQFSCGKICWEVVAVVQSLSHVWLFVTPQSTAHQASLSFTISWSLCKLMFIESVTPSNHLILCGPLPILSSIFPRIRVFTNELALHIRWPKYWSFSFSISPSNEYAGLISLKIDWFDLLAAQGILKSLSQHQCLKHQFFSVQPSLWSSSSVHDYWKKPWLWQYGPLLAKWCWPERTQNIRPKQRRMMNYFFWSLTTFFRSYEQCPTLLCSNLNHIAIRSTKHSQHSNTRSVHWA